ncbi:MAG: hypothetical protein KDB23_04755 [Planctomycetales bacterium]|nr:hypothetical protein [Planctomycetales bacterium]
MLKRFRVVVVCTMCTAMASIANAGVGLQYGGHDADSSGQPFNFAVSTASGGSIGQLNASSGDGELTHGTGGHRQLDILSLFQRPRMSNYRSFGGGGGGGSSRSLSTSSVSSSAAGGLGALVAASQDQTSGSTPVNTGTCFCLNNNGNAGGNGQGGSGQGGDDNGGNGQGGDNGQGGNGGNGNGGDDNGGIGGGEGPSPSVVPEPGSLALWTIAGGLLVSVTRRRS